MGNKIDPITEFILEEMIDEVPLEEKSKRTSRTTVSRQTKIKRATGQLATTTARKKNDPVYKRMVYYRDLFHKYRSMLHKKYGPRVRSRARR